jgi:hypothetical protein
MRRWLVALYIDTDLYLYRDHRNSSTDSVGSPLKAWDRDFPP